MTFYGNTTDWFLTFTVQKTKFFSKDFFSKCDQIRSFLENGKIFNGKLYFLRSVSKSFK